MATEGAERRLLQRATQEKRMSALVVGVEADVFLKAESQECSHRDSTLIRTKTIGI